MTNPLAKAIAQAIEQAVPPADRTVRATVAVINGDGTLDLTVAPSGTYTKVRRNAAYTPTVGDVVLMTTIPGGDRIVTMKLT